MRLRLLFPLLLLLASVEAQTVGQVQHVTVSVANQRIDLAWDPVPSAVGYRVRIYDDGVLVNTTNTTQPHHRYLGSNGRTYVFTVAARAQDGTEGPPSVPVAATPTFSSDLAYLATGLILTWTGLFAYAFFLNRREARLDRQLEQLLQHQAGRNPP